MTAFDDLFMAEVDEISDVCLDGKSLADPSIDPLRMAGGVMWAIRKRGEPGLSWDEFRRTTSMGDIRAFSIEMEAQQLVDPT